MRNKLSSGCGDLDSLLGGGFEPGIITQIYGEAGSGKTNILLQLSVQAITSGFKVIFIDTEGFSVDRFKQVAGADAREMATKIVVFEPFNLEQQQVAIRDSSKIVNKDFGLLMVDSATALYRAALEGDDNRSIHRSLASQLGDLQEIARRYRIPVVITNQVYLEIESGNLRPLGGMAMSHACKTVIALENLSEGRRKARLMKHRSQPDGITAEFKITQHGIE